MQMSAGDNWQGKMVGRYRLIQLLGRGGMGEVWLAEDSQLRRQVAAKLLPAVLASDRSYLQNFEREARAAAALEHPHILPVHDFGDQRIAEDEVVTYLIMPHITGGSLRDRIQDVTGSTHRRLSSNEALHYLRQAAQAIDYAHSRNVIHRDIKPANMLLQQDWLLLADFGLAKLITSTTLRSRTLAGSGTPEYMAPEQARGKAEFASDRYSFAVIAYLLFTGHVPFSGDTYYSVLIKHLTEEPPAPRRFNPSLPQAVEQALLQGLAKQPGDRPTSCMALVTTLEHGWQVAPVETADPDATVLAPWRIQREDNVPAASLSTAGEQQGKVSRRMFLVGGTSAALVAVAAGRVAIYALSHRAPTSSHTSTKRGKESPGLSHGEELPPPAGACCSCIVLFPLASFEHSCYNPCVRSGTSVRGRETVRVQAHLPN